MPNRVLNILIENFEIEDDVVMRTNRQIIDAHAELTIRAQ